MTTVGIQYLGTLETIRHNKEMEQLGWGELVVKKGTLDETIRHNQVYEREIQRHNIETEAISRESNRIAGIQAGASVKQAQAAMLNAQTNAKLADSTINLNLSKIALTDAQVRTESAKRGNVLADTGLKKEKRSTEVLTQRKIAADTSKSKSETNLNKQKTSESKTNAKAKTVSTALDIGKFILEIGNTASKGVGAAASLITALV